MEGEEDKDNAPDTEWKKCKEHKWMNSQYNLK